jgi:hypothetical protein
MSHVRLNFDFFHPMAFSHPMTIVTLTITWLDVSIPPRSIASAVLLCPNISTAGLLQ